MLLLALLIAALAELIGLRHRGERAARCLRCRSDRPAFSRRGRSRQRRVGAVLPFTVPRTVRLRYLGEQLAAAPDGGGSRAPRMLDAIKC